MPSSASPRFSRLAAGGQRRTAWALKLLRRHGLVPVLRRRRARRQSRGERLIVASDVAWVPGPGPQVTGVSPSAGPDLAAEAAPAAPQAPASGQAPAAL